jgi:antirestriction protein ArdC
LKGEAVSKVYDVVASRIISCLESGTAPWRKPWIGGGPCNLVSRKDYSGINVLLLGCTPYASRYWITYKQAQSLGGNVRKGEKSTPIVFYSPLPAKTNASGEVESSSVGRCVLRYYSGFNLEQCEGIEKPEEAREVREVPPIDIVEEVVQSMPKRPYIYHGHGQAYYVPATDEVRMPDRAVFETSEAYYSTLLHELAHATGHKSRLNRTKGSSFGSTSYAAEELVAEVASCMVLGYLGLDSTLEQSAAYCDGWAKRLRGMTSSQAVCRALTAASKAADWIRGTHSACKVDEAEAVNA